MRIWIEIGHDNVHDELRETISIDLVMTAIIILGEKWRDKVNKIMQCVRASI